MNLGDRRGGYRRAEFAEDLVDRLAQLVSQDLARLRISECRHAVLQARQAAREPLADDIAAGGQDLAELDVGRAQLLQRAGQPLTRILCQIATAENAHDTSQPAGRCRIQRLVLRWQDRVVPGQGQRGACQADERGESGKHVSGLEVWA